MRGTGGPTRGDAHCTCQGEEGPPGGDACITSPIAGPWGIHTVGSKCSHFCSVPPNVGTLEGLHTLSTGDHLSPIHPYIESTTILSDSI